MTGHAQQPTTPSSQRWVDTTVTLPACMKPLLPIAIMGMLFADIALVVHEKPWWLSNGLFGLVTASLIWVYYRHQQHKNTLKRPGDTPTETFQLEILLAIYVFGILSGWTLAYLTACIHLGAAAIIFGLTVIWLFVVGFICAAFYPEHTDDNAARLYRRNYGLSDADPSNPTGYFHRNRRYHNAQDANRR